MGQELRIAAGVCLHVDTTAQVF